jgi:hypothetical protein
MTKEMPVIFPKVTQTTAGPRSREPNWAIKIITVNPGSDKSANNSKGRNGKGKSSKGKSSKGKSSKGKSSKGKNGKEKNGGGGNSKGKSAGAEVPWHGDTDRIESEEDAEGDNYERVMDAYSDDNDPVCPQLGTGREELRCWVEDTYSKGQEYHLSHPELDVKTFSVCVFIFIWITYMSSYPISETCPAENSPSMGNPWAGQ